MKLLGVAGRKNSGKDTVAGELVAHHGYARVALADAVKRLASAVFGSYDLWDRRETKELPLPQATGEQWWMRAAENIGGPGVRWQIQELLPGAERDLIPPAHRLRALLTDLYARVGYKLSPRIILQQLGTEWGRACRDTIWTDALVRVCAALANGEMGYRPEVGLYVHLGAPAPVGVVVPDVRFRNEVDLIHSERGEVWWVEAGERLAPWTPEHASEPDPEQFRRLCDDELDNRGAKENLWSEVLRALGREKERSGR